MLYATPHLAKEQQDVLAELDRLRRRIGDRAGVPAPWLGQLRRDARAAAGRSSISIEGFHVSEGEARAIVSGDPAGNAEARLAFACYARAMDHVGVMADDPRFTWNERVILDLHFDACLFQRDRSPGRYRTGPIAVTGPDGPLAFVGPDAEDVPELLSDAADWLEHGDLDAHAVVRAAMAHLHVVSIHPFRDGNGRVSRIVQSLVLAREGVLAAELGSIEGYLGEHTAQYYAALGEVQGGSYQPARDALPWVAFCLHAHLDQARRRLRQIEHAAARFAVLERLVEQRGWPDRLVIALEQAAVGGTDRSSYMAEAGIAAPTASADFRRLEDAGLVDRRGRTRNTHFEASAHLRALIESA